MNRVVVLRALQKAMAGVGEGAQGVQTSNARQFSHMSMVGSQSKLMNRKGHRNKAPKIEGRVGWLA